jgi:hypothetical protein
LRFPDYSDCFFQNLEKFSARFALAMLKPFMDRDVWNMIVSQGHSDDSEYVYRLAEKIVLHLGSIYEWPRTALTTFAGLQGSLKHNRPNASCMGRFQFAVWAIGNGCPSALLKEWAIARKLIRDPNDLRSFCKLCDGLEAGTVTEVAGRPITFTLMAHLRSRRCEIGELGKCKRVGCSEPAPFPQDKLDFPCSKCSEDYYVENYGRLTEKEWAFLEPQVQEYNKALLARYGIDATDHLTPIEMRLSERLQMYKVRA